MQCHEMGEAYATTPILSEVETLYLSQIVMLYNQQLERTQ